MKFFLVGIKGTGMCALAKTLKDMNNDVFGSDTSKIFFTDKILKDNNIKWKKFNKANITNEYIYIISSCYDKEHLEVKEIMEKGYEYYYYHEFIEKYFKNKIGISGTHGKSTTTSFLVDLFKGKNISGVIGDGTGIGKEKYDYFIFEACEYQKHILTYSFDYLIINNIEEDHLDCYKDIDEIYKTFIEASKKSKCLICNENIKIEHVNKYTFGKGKDNYCFYNIIEKNNKGYKLLITIDNLNYEVDFPFYGKHMIYNLLASITVYYLVNKELNNLQEKINSFRILNRRMNEYYIYDNVIIDDYAHHPTEIKALLSGLEQKYPDKELIVVFQPHTYSRTFSLAKAFVQCFGNYKTYIRNTFTSGREQYSKELEDEVRKIFANYQEYEINKIKKYLEERKKVIVFVGAGDNYNCIQELMKIFSENS